MVWECFTGLKEKAFNSNAAVNDDEIEDEIVKPECKPEYYTAIRLETRINDNGESNTYRITEERKVLNGSEQVVSSREVLVPNNGPIEKVMPTSRFGRMLKKKMSVDENQENISIPEDLDAFRTEVLCAHNDYRKRHKANGLKLSNDLNEIAQNWAETMARTGSLSHRPDGKMGENIFAGYKSDGSISGNHVVKLWFDEIANYDFKNNEFQPKTGHFTQVVWKSSKRLGVGKAIASNGFVYVCANYDPAGNVKTQFDKNVTPEKKGFF